jgi:hypothetical protein
MAAQKQVQRSWDSPDVAFRFKSDGSSVRIYVLDAHEWMDMGTSTHHVHSTGPGAAVCIIENSPSGQKFHEHYVNDPSIWAWISRLIANAGEYGMEVLTQFDDGNNPAAKYPERKLDKKTQVGVFTKPASPA